MSVQGLHESVLAQLGPEITNGGIAPGEVIRLEEIEQRFGVSRTVAREAIKMLESMAMVESRRRVGIVVRPMVEWDVYSPRVIRWRLDGPGRLQQLATISQLRLGVEPLAAALAAEHASPEQCASLVGAVMGMTATAREQDLEAYLQHDIVFHTTLLRASGNEMLAALHGVVAEVLAGRTHHGLMPQRPNPVAIALHRDVADAVAARDHVRAEAAMREIVGEAREAMARETGHPDLAK